HGQSSERGQAQAEHSDAGRQVADRLAMAIHVVHALDGKIPCGPLGGLHPGDETADVCRQTYGDGAISHENLPARLVMRLNRTMRTKTIAVAAAALIALAGCS